jgi:hypothetical protein
MLIIQRHINHYYTFYKRNLNIKKSLLLTWRVTTIVTQYASYRQGGLGGSEYTPQSNDLTTL